MEYDDNLGPLPLPALHSLSVESRNLFLNEAPDSEKIGTVLRVRLPSDFVITDGPGLSLVHQGPPSLLSASFAAAAAIVAVAPRALAARVTRRFWSNRK